MNLDVLQVQDNDSSYQSSELNSNTNLDSSQVQGICFLSPILVQSNSTNLAV